MTLTINTWPTHISQYSPWPFRFYLDNRHMSCQINDETITYYNNSVISMLIAKVTGTILVKYDFCKQRVVFIVCLLGTINALIITWLHNMKFGIYCIQKSLLKIGFCRQSSNHLGLKGVNSIHIRKLNFI